MLWTYSEKMVFVVGFVLSYFPCRLIGLALLHGEIFPLCLTRATVKYILGHARNWSDFAFHDPLMFETLRKLIVDCETALTDNELADLCLYFAADLPKEEVCCS